VDIKSISGPISDRALESAASIQIYIFRGGAKFPSIPFSSLPFLPSPLLSSPSLPLEVGPLNPARGLGRSEVWGGAPAEIEFGAF